MISPPGNIQRRGATVYQSNPLSGGVDVVSSIANTHGIMLRSVLLFTRTGFFSAVTIGGADMFYAANGNTFHYLGPGILISPNTVLRVGGNGVAAGDAAVILTYDLLS